MTTTIPAVLDHAATAFGDREGLVDGEVRLTFAQLRDHAHRAARAVARAGIAKGDRVAIWAPNINEWVVAALGASCAGAALVPLNTRFKGPEAAYVLRKSGARVLFTVNGFLGNDYVSMLRGCDEGRDLPALERIVVMRGDDVDGTETFTSFVDAGGAATGGTLPDVGPDDVSDLIFTSGTTGRPKGVVTTHHQTVKVFETWSEIVGLREGDRYLIVNPFFHTFGYKAGFVACLIRGATIVPEAVFDVDAVLRKVEAERISMLPGPPTLYQSILNHPEREKYDLSTLRLAVTGAAPVPVELIRRMREELTFETILTAYGLTEATGTVTMCRQGDAPEVISNSSGRAIPDVEVRIVDDAGNDVPTGEPGEIVVRGYNVMQGYFEDADATARAIDAGGWLHTGDIGVMDAGGNVDITDRKKDMFIVGGFNAYPAEIEGELLRHPAIAQVAVVGAPDERMGEVGVAFVVARAGATVDADDVIAWARERMANYKVPRRVEVVDALPLNASGKVLKFELRERAATTMR
ncbi:MAG TPA: FadD3 family acyl-CoA ligase [Acidimicrobiales bacterium]|nr:FadD3 family acyl-CoA ligase [Acidimicrobiales bacterium]